MWGKLSGMQRYDAFTRFRFRQRKSSITTLSVPKSQDDVIKLLFFGSQFQLKFQLRLNISIWEKYTDFTTSDIQRLLASISVPSFCTI